MKFSSLLSASQEVLHQLCREYHVAKLSLFGSAIRDALRPDSDIDVLVEFAPHHSPGLLGLARMSRALSVLFGGRQVDLRTPAELSRYFRDEVLRTAIVQYAAR